MSYFIRLTIEAVIFASLIYISCEGSWRAEHGPRLWFLERTADHTEYGRNSSFLRAFLDIPAVVYITVAAVIYILYAGPFNKNFITFISSTVSALSLYYLLLIPAHPFLRKHICSRACVLLWTSPLFLVLIWFLYSTSDLSMLMRRQPLLIIYIPSGVSRIILIAWLLPAAVFFTAQIVYHFATQHRISAAAVPVTDPAVKSLLKIECDRIKYGSAPLLYRSSSITTPMTFFGPIHRILYLPDRKYSRDELQLIYRHELRHLQRGDIETKIFMAFIRALFWFDPLFWIAIRKVSDDIELACDELVLENESDDTRREYAALLLTTAGSSAGFSTCLSASAASLRYRLKAVMEPRRYRKGSFAVAAAMFLTYFLFGLISIVWH